MTLSDFRQTRVDLKSMTMKTKLLICLAALLGVAAVDAVKKLSTLPKLRVTARVIDESGNPMSGALVSFVFGEPNNAKAIVKVEGVTRSDGLFTGEGYSDGSYGAGISKDGFYRSGLGAAPVSGIVNGRWEPWDKTYDAILRPIGNPVPFYAKRVQTDIPVLDQPCGYDLEKGDWVAPYGKGTKADFIFKGHRDFKSRNDFEVRVEMAFSSRRDGVLKTELPAIGRYSSFKWEREAPQGGYAQSTELRNAATADAVIHTFERTDAFFSVCEPSRRTVVSSPRTMEKYQAGCDSTG